MSSIVGVILGRLNRLGDMVGGEVGLKLEPCGDSEEYNEGSADSAFVIDIVGAPEGVSIGCELGLIVGNELQTFVEGNSEGSQLGL
jgi:hypothetical protein